MRTSTASKLAAAIAKFEAGGPATSGAAQDPISRLVEELRRHGFIAILVPVTVLPALTSANNTGAPEAQAAA